MTFVLPVAVKVYGSLTLTPAHCLNIVTLGNKLDNIILTITKEEEEKKILTVRVC